MIGEIAIDITMAITKRVARMRFLKSKSSNNQPMTYPGITYIIGKSTKAIKVLTKSCNVKLIELMLFLDQFGRIR